MSGQDLPRYTEELARKWRAVAERRRHSLLELYRSGRWSRYFSEEQLTAQMRDAERDIGRWRELAGEAANDPVPVGPASFGHPVDEAAE